MTIQRLANQFEDAVAQYVTRPEPTEDQEPVTQRWDQDEAPPTLRSREMPATEDSNETKLAKLIKKMLLKHNIVTGPLHHRQAGFDHAADVSFDVLTTGNEEATLLMRQAIETVLGKPTESNANLHIWDKPRARIVWAHKPNEANWVRVMERMQPTQQLANQFEQATAAE